MDLKAHNGFQVEAVLKSDAFGRIEKGLFEGQAAIKRVYTTNILLRPLAKLLAHNELKALKALNGVGGYFPFILEHNKNYHIRAYIEGKSMHHDAERISAKYFTQAKRLLRIMRKAGVANNDLAKEANWLITVDGCPAVTDFQLASYRKKSTSKLLLLMAREDLRHLLKHKRKYSKVSALEKTILQQKSLPSRIWKNTVKQAYLFVTRKLLGWEERSGPEERSF